MARTLPTYGFSYRQWLEPYLPMVSGLGHERRFVLRPIDYILAQARKSVSLACLGCLLAYPFLFSHFCIAFCISDEGIIVVH
jgi:hypothetical protein